jgi:tRNA(fMet)-specific endonuclease VapC
MPNQVVIDTNVYVAFMRGEQWASDLLSTTTTILVPFIVLGELYYGFYNGTKAQENTAALNMFMCSSRVHILECSEKTPKIFGEISAELARTGKPTQTNDIWIAALCKENGYSLATKDKAFANILGLEIVN